MKLRKLSRFKKVKLKNMSNVFLIYNMNKWLYIFFFLYSWIIFYRRYIAEMLSIRHAKIISQHSYYHINIDFTIFLLFFFVTGAGIYIALMAGSIGGSFVLVALITNVYLLHKRYKCTYALSNITPIWFLLHWFII